MKRLIALIFLLIALRADAAMMDSARWDWEAYRWQTNITTSGGTISGSSYLTGTRFMNQVKQWGVRSQLGRVNLYLGDNTNACTTPIIVDWFNTTLNDDLIAFAAADYTEATGLTGNGSTKYLRCCKASGLNIGSFSATNNVHLAAYVRTGSNEASDLMGAGTASDTRAMAVSNAGNTYVFLGANVTSTADSSGVGFYLSTRTAGNLAVTYKNGTALVTDSANDTGSPVANTAFMVHAINVNGSVLAHTSRALSYYGIGLKIAPSLVSPYGVAVLNVQKAKNRAVP